MKKVIIGILMMMLLTGCGKKEEKKEEKPNREEQTPIEKEEREYAFKESKIIEEGGKKYVVTKLKNKGEKLQVGEVFIEIYKKYGKGKEEYRRNVKTVIVKVEKSIGKEEEIEIKEEIELEDSEDTEIECSIAGEVRIYE